MFVGFSRVPLIFYSLFTPYVFQWRFSSFAFLKLIRQVGFSPSPSLCLFLFRRSREMRNSVESSSYAVGGTYFTQRIVNALVKRNYSCFIYRFDSFSSIFSHSRDASTIELFVEILHCLIKFALDCVGNMLEKFLSRNKSNWLHIFTLIWLWKSSH